MEGVRREHLGSAYMEEPRRGHTDTGEEMEVAAVGVRGRGRWEPRSTSRPAFMVSKAADAAVWEDLKGIKPPMYDGNPPNLDRFLEKLHDWGVTVTEDMDPADAERYVFVYAKSTRVWALHTNIPTIRPQGDLNRVNLPFFPISNQPNFQPIKPAEISKLTTHSSPSEHGNDTNNSN